MRWVIFAALIMLQMLAGPWDGWGEPPGAPLIYDDFGPPHFNDGAQGFNRPPPHFDGAIEPPAPRHYYYKEPGPRHHGRGHRDDFERQREREERWLNDPRYNRVW